MNLPIEKIMMMGNIPPWVLCIVCNSCCTAANIVDTKS